MYNWIRCSRMDNLNLHTKKSHGLTWKVRRVIDTKKRSNYSYLTYIVPRPVFLFNPNLNYLLVGPGKYLK